MHLRQFGGGGGSRRHGCVVTILPEPVEPIKLRKRGSLSISADSKKQRVNKQACCHFLEKLPTEIRILIYREVLQSWSRSGRMHIFGKFSRGDRKSLSCTTCRFSSDEEFNAKQLLSNARSGDPLTQQQQQVNVHRMGYCWKGDLDEYSKSGLASPVKGTHLSLFLTCRIIYSEAIDLLYSSFSFDLVGLYSAYRFLSLVPLQRLQQMRFLQISGIQTPVAYRFPEKTPKEWYPSTEKQWIRVCSVLRAAQGLQSLTIKFSESTPDPCSPEQEEKMLALLIGIRVPKNNFSLQLPWFYESDFIERISGSTCTVQRGVRASVGIYPHRRDRRRDVARPSGIGIVAGWVCGITAMIVCGPCLAVYGSIHKIKKVRRKEKTSPTSQDY